MPAGHFPSPTTKHSRCTRLSAWLATSCVLLGLWMTSGSTARGDLASQLSVRQASASSPSPLRLKQALRRRQSLSNDRQAASRYTRDHVKANANAIDAATPGSIADSQFTLAAEDPERINLKAQLLQLAAALDRGQSYNPQRSGAYEERADKAREIIERLVEIAPPIPESPEALDGEWEMVYTTVKYGIFRSSPFFLAVQEAFGDAEAFGQKSAELFFRLHELQTCSFGLSTIGRVAQYIDTEKGVLASEFDTTLLGLTTIPIIGWFKLFPTFGGCVITVSKAQFDKDTKDINMEVDYTTFKPVPGLTGGIPGSIMWDRKVPVGAVWQILPWNGGRKATCSVKVVYLDDSFRIVQDRDGEMFVYARPVSPRSTLSSALVL